MNRKERTPRPRTNRRMRHQRGVVSGGVAATALVANLVLLIIAFVAVGAPATPGVALAQTLNPSVAQSVQLTFNSAVRAFDGPNSIVETGPHVTYSVWAGSTILYANQTQGLSPGSGASLFYYPVTGTVMINIPLLCSSTCATYLEVIKVQAQVITQSFWPGGVWASSVATVNFTNSAGASVGTQPGVAPAGAFAMELGVPLLGLVVLDTVLLGAFGGVPGRIWALWFIALPSVIAIIALLVLVYVLGVH
jgi:hypothetical protein